MTLTPEWCAANATAIQDTYDDLLEAFGYPPGYAHRLLTSTPVGETLSTRIVFDDECGADEVSDTRVLMYIAASVLAGVKMPLILRTEEPDGTETSRMWLFEGETFDPLSAERAREVLGGTAKTEPAWGIVLSPREVLQAA